EFRRVLFRSEVARPACRGDHAVRRAVAGKPRVHELAKEFGITRKELLTKLRDQGEFVKSASSTLEAPVVRRLREAHAPADGGTDSASTKRPAGGAAPKPG